MKIKSFSQTWPLQTDFGRSQQWMLWGAIGWQIWINHDFSMVLLCMEAAAGSGQSCSWTPRRKNQSPGSPWALPWQPAGNVLPNPFLCSQHFLLSARGGEHAAARFPSAFSWLQPRALMQPGCKNMPQSPAKTWTSCQEKYLEYLLPSVASLHEPHPKVCFAENNIYFPMWSCSCSRAPSRDCQSCPTFQHPLLAGQVQPLQFSPDPWTAPLVFVLGFKPF